jgi:ABC-2 type transport system ATP-binding protein
MSNPIVISHLTKRFKDVTAVDDLSFSVPSGRITGFLGPNGAGKSTTLRCLLGLAKPTSGTVHIFDAPYAELSHPLTRVGVVLDSRGFNPGLSAKDNLTVLAHAAGIPLTRIADVLEQVEIAHAAKRQVKGFSLGMKQRLSLAGALLGNPEVLILDEPANGLDPQGISWLRQFLRGLASEGKTVLVSSHQLAEMQNTVDDVVIINRGKLVAEGEMKKIIGKGTLEEAFLKLTTGGAK